MEATIPDRGPHWRSFGCSRLSIRLGLNFDQAIANSVMTHVMVLSAKVRWNERLNLGGKLLLMS